MLLTVLLRISRENRDNRRVVFINGLLNFWREGRQNNERVGVPGVRGDAFRSLFPAKYSTKEVRKNDTELLNSAIGIGIEVAGQMMQTS